MLIDSPNKNYYIKLNGAITTNELTWIVEYLDTTRFSSLDGTTSGATPVVMVTGLDDFQQPPLNANKAINKITILNIDTAPQTVTVYLDDDSAIRNEVKILLPVGYSLRYENGNGWYVLDTNGARVNVEISLSAIEIGDTVVGAVINKILYVDAAGTLQQVTLGTNISMTTGTLNVATMGGETLAQTLALGHVTGGNNIEISVGDALIVDDATVSTIAGFDASKKLVTLSTATYPSLTELSYVKNVTSSIQTQFGTKAPIAAPTFTGIVTLGQDGASGLQAVTYQQLLVAINGGDKEAVIYATVAALPAVVYANGTLGVGATLTGVSPSALSIDGNTPSIGDRILVKNQGSTFQNGWYVVTTVGSGIVVFVLTRATDANVSAEFKTGDASFVTSGTTLSITTWAYNGIDNPTMGTTAITFVQTAGQGSFIAGNGISITGTTIAIDTSVTVDKTTVQTLTNKTLTSAILTTPTLGVAGATSIAITGTGGNGFATFLTQSAQANYGASGFALYANSTGNFAWSQQADTFARSFAGTLTADRIYTFQNKAYTIAGLDDVGLGCDFRLSLVTGTAITTTDCTYAAAQSIYFVPYKGNMAKIYDGSIWQGYTFSEINIALGSAATGMFDIFLYANSGTPTLETLIWTNTSTRATNLVLQDGVWCKTGALTRRYVGTYYNPGNKSSTVTMTLASPCVVTYTGHALPVNAPIVFSTTGALYTGLTAGTTYFVASLSTTGTVNSFNVSLTPGGALINTSGTQSGTHTATIPTYTEDSEANRFLFNYYNAEPRKLFRNDPTTSHIYTINTNRQSNANIFNQVNFVTGITEKMAAFALKIQAGNSTANVSFLGGIGVNSVTTIANSQEATAQIFQPSTSTSVVGNAGYAFTPTLGLNYVSMIEFSSATGTTTWFDAKGSLVGMVTQ